jgi:MFS transporter, DHA2 family, multidrug resistance protein
MTSPPASYVTDLIGPVCATGAAVVASGISETGAELGGALGISLLRGIRVNVYRTQVADGAPAGLPPAVARRRRTRSAGPWRRSSGRRPGAERPWSTPPTAASGRDCRSAP